MMTELQIMFWAYLIGVVVAGFMFICGVAINSWRKKDIHLVALFLLMALNTFMLFMAIGAFVDLPFAVILENTVL